MNIEVKLALEIMRAEFAKMGFIPNDNIGCTNFVVSRPTGEKSVDDGGEVFDVLKNKFCLRARLCFNLNNNNKKKKRQLNLQQMLGEVMAIEVGARCLSENFWDAVCCKRLCLRHHSIRRSCAPFLAGHTWIPSWP